MDAARLSQDEYEGISNHLERLNAQRVDSIEGPGMRRESSWALFEPALLLKVIQDDAGKVTVLVSDVQLMSGTQFLEIALAAIKVKAKATMAA